MDARFTCCLCSVIHVEENIKKEEEEKANEKEADRKEDTTEEKTDPAQDKDKSSNKDTKDSSLTECNRVSKERDTKPEPTDSTKAKVDKKEPTEQQPKEVEGNKDPGGLNGTKTEAANDQADAKKPDTSSDTDNSQQVQNGMYRKFHIRSDFTVFSIIPFEYILLFRLKNTLKHPVD